MSPGTRSMLLGVLLVVGVGTIVWATGAGTKATPEVAAPAPGSTDKTLIRPDPPPERAPVVAFSLPTREARTPAPLTDKASVRDLAAARKVLFEVVETRARDHTNPWAVSHALLALGADFKLDNGEDPVDYLFREYAQVVDVGGTSLIEFPPMRGAVRIEPHTDLLLKAFTEAGITPDRPVTVAGRPFTLADLYRHSLWRAWITGTTTGFRDGTYNDAPWALQGLAAWAPRGLAWTAQGGRETTLATLTHRLAEVLADETEEMRVAMAAGESLQKDIRRGLFRYTCGGQHLLQGVAYSVGRGFELPGDRTEVCRQLEVLMWRIDVELNAVDPAIASGDRPVKIVLLAQRLKFLGHFLETVHKIGALGVCELGDAPVQASRRVAHELAVTVADLGALGVWADLDGIRTDATLGRYRDPEQVYLDLVGDSAHAVRGIDLATGRGTIRY